MASRPIDGVGGSDVVAASRWRAGLGRTASMGLLAAAIAASGAIWSQSPPPPSNAITPFEEAEPLLRVFGPGLPASLARRTSAGPDAGWAAWVASRDAEIRARVHRGDQDSVVNLWLFGTSFTTRPRATAPLISALGSQASAALLQARLDDLVAGLRSPRDNAWLVVARRVLERDGVDVLASAGRLDAARHLAALRARMMTERQRVQRDSASARLAGHNGAALEAYLAYDRGRGLVSDTSLFAAYGVERALDVLTSRHLAAPASIRRVAVVGPGLDLVDKADGHDFYPQQTLQPFAVVDSLVRAGLVSEDGIEVTAYDISARVMDHLAEAQAQVRRGEPYTVHLALDPDTPSHPWHPDLVAYWQRFGNWIGADVPPQPTPAGMEGIRVRAVRVAPHLVASLRAADLNIVLERPTPSALPVPFDLVVATNVLGYYGPFEQALALANIASMLRPGGLLLANRLSASVPVGGWSSPLPVDVVFERQQKGDTLWWLRKGQR